MRQHPRYPDIFVAEDGSVFRRRRIPPAITRSATGGSASAEKERARRMNGEELRLHLESLELPQRRFAVIMGVSYSTVKRWLTNEAPIPVPVVALMRLLDRGVITTQWIERVSQPIGR